MALSYLSYTWTRESTPPLSTRSQPRNDQDRNTDQSGLFVCLGAHGVALQVVGAVAQPVVCRHLIQGAQGHRGEGGVRHLRRTTVHNSRGRKGNGRRTSL